MNNLEQMKKRRNRISTIIAILIVLNLLLLLAFATNVGDEGITTSYNVEEDSPSVVSDEEEIRYDGNINIADVATGADFTVALDSNGYVWSWGQNGKGQLGNGTINNSIHKQAVLLEETNSKGQHIQLSNVKQIAVGEYHAAALTNDGEVYTWGHNYYGQTGNNLIKNGIYPQKVKELDGITIKQISCGANYTLVLSQSGEVYGFGDSSDGQLGYYNDLAFTSIREIESRDANEIRLFNIKEISAGYNHIIAIDNNNKVLTWGDNTGKDFKLTNINEVAFLGETVKEIKSGNGVSIALTESGNVYTWNLGSTTPTRVTLPTKEGSTESIQIRMDSNKSSISIVNKTYYIIDTDNNVYSWGANTVGQTGTGDTSASSLATPTKIVISDDVVQKEIDRVGSSIVPGVNYLGTTSSTGEYDTAYAINTDGYILGWGYAGSNTVNVSNPFKVNNGKLLGDVTRNTVNYIGNIALKDVQGSKIELKVEESKKLLDILQQNGNLVDERVNLYRKINTNELSRLKVKMADPNIANYEIDTDLITGVRMGRTFAEVATERNTIKIDVKVTDDNYVAYPKIESNDNYTLALKSDGTVWAWGYNTYLGITDSSQKNNRVSVPTQIQGISGVVDISAGENFALLLTQDGTVWSWGYNASGQLGNGTKTSTARNSIATSKVSLQKVRGFDANTEIVSISAGGNFAMALDEKDNIYVWGSGASYQLATGKTGASTTAIKVNTSSLSGERIRQIEAGYRTAYVVTESGYIYTWGSNGSHKCGNLKGSYVKTPTKITNVSGVTKISSGTSYTVALKSNGTLWGMGANFSTGKTISTISNVSDVVATDVSYGAIFKYIDGTVGYGTYLNKTSPTITKLTSIEQTGYFTDTMLIAGSNGAYAVAKTDGTVWTVGKNNFAQLGNRSTNTSTTTKLSCISFDYAALNKHEITLKKGETEELSAIYNYGFNIFYSGDINIELKYKSLNEGIANVEENIITGIKSGKTYVEGLYEQRDIVVRVIVNVLSEEEVATPKVSAGYRHTLALKSNGTVWGWGYDYRGALGGKNRTISEPTKLSLSKRYIDIVAGYDYSLFVDTDGYVWAMGYNSYGQLGNNKTTSSSTPVKVQTQYEYLKDIVKVESMYQTSFALDKNGNVYAWGSGAKRYATLVNTYGLKAIEICGNLILTEDGHVLHYKNLTNIEIIGELQNIVQISNSKHTNSSTYGYFMALDAKGNVYTWIGSSNNDKITGLETKVPTKLNIKTEENVKIVDIQAGGEFALAMDNNGDVYSWGKSKYLYALGRGEDVTSTDAIKPMKLEELSNIDIESISAPVYMGSYHYARGYAVTRGGSVFAFGYNGKYNLLGNADTINYYTPTLIGESRAKFIVDGKEVTRLYLDTNEIKDVQVTLSDSFNLRVDDNQLSGESEFDWILLNENVVNLSGEKGNIKTLTANDMIGEAIVTATSKDTGAIARLYVEVKTKDSKVAPKVESAKNHTLALKSDGTVWGWGVNNYGQLGVSALGDISEPQQAVIDDGNTVVITDIATSINHTLMLTTDGDVYSCGYNGYGQLGYSTSSNYQAIPKKVDQLSDIVKIAVGDRYSLALDKYGRLWFFGYSSIKVNNQSYTLSKTTPSKVTRITGVDMRDYIFNAVDITNEYILTKDGEVISINLSLDVTSSNGNARAGTKVEFDANENVKIIKITRTSGEKCSGHTAFLTDDGRVYTIGLGTSGQLGNGENLSVNKAKSAVQVIDSNGVTLKNIVDVYTGDTHSIAIDKNGTIYTWGSNNYGELRNAEVDIGKNYNRAHIVAQDSRIEKGIVVSAGNKYSIVVDETGYVYAWGLGTNGQLGNALSVNSVNAVRVGMEGIKLDTNHVTLKEKGSNIKIDAHSKQLNLLYNPTIDIVSATSSNENVVTANKSTDSNSSLEISAVNAGTTSVLVTAKENDDLNGKTCSSVIEATVLPEKAEMSDDVTLPANKIITPMTVSGYSHTIILKSDGTVWAYGDNTYGQLGTDPSMPYSDKVIQVEFPSKVASIVCVAAGDNFSVAVDANGDTYAWGYSLTSMSENYTPELVQDLSNITKVVAGKEHCLALDKDGYVYAWGLNSSGALGIASASTVTKPCKVSNIANAIDIAVGTDHSMILTANGDVYTSGNNDKGQLGISDISSRTRFDKVNIDAIITYIEAGNGTSIAIDTDGNLWVWGNNATGQLGLGTNDRKVSIPTKCNVANELKVQSASAGSSHTQVVTTTGELYTVGSNNYGQLGIGSDVRSTNSFAKVEKLGNNVMKANAGTTYSTVIAKDGTVYGCGDYNHGNTNRVSLTNSNEPVKLLNDILHLNEQEITLNLNKTYSINANGGYKFNVLYKYIDQFRYESANANIASVSETGVITGNSVGTTRINIIDDSGRISSILVKVLPDDAIQSPTVEGGNKFAVVTDQDGRMYLFGNNEGIINSDIPEKINDKLSLKTVKAGDNFIVAINYDGYVWTYGDNTYNQLGMTNVSTPNDINKINSNYIKAVTQIDAGSKHVIALDNMGKVYVWGDNSNGQLGISLDTAKVVTPTVIKPILDRAVSVSAGGNYSSIVDSEGYVYILGDGEVKQVTELESPLTGAIKVETGTEETAVLASDGKVYLVNNKTAMATLKVSDKNIVDIAVNSDTFMCLTADRTLYTFGNNENGQVGIGSDNTTIDTITLVATDVFTMGGGDTNTYYINTNGEVFAAGLNTSGELGNGTRDIVASPTHKSSSTYTKVGDRRFNINIIKADKTEREVSSIKVPIDWTILTGKEDIKELLEEERTKITILKENKEFNAFKNVIGNISDYTFKLEDNDVASLSVSDKAQIKTNTSGETILQVTNTVTAEEKELKIIVTDEQLRIEEMYVLDSKNKTYDAEPDSESSYIINTEGSTQTGTLNVLLTFEDDILSVVDEDGNNLTVRKNDKNEWVIEGLDIGKPLQELTLTITSEDGEEHTYIVTIRKEIIIKVDSEILTIDEENNYTKFINPDNTTANVEVNILDSENTIIIKDAQGNEIAKSEEGSNVLTTQVDVPNREEEFTIEVVNPDGNIVRNSKLRILKSSLKSISVKDVTNIFGEVTATRKDNASEGYVDEFHVEVDEKNNPSSITMSIINENVQAVKINGEDEKSISGAGVFTFDTEENEIDIEFTVLDVGTGNTYIEKYKLTIHKMSSDAGIQRITLHTVNGDEYEQEFEKSLDKKNTYEITLHNGSYDLSDTIFNFTVELNNENAQLSINSNEWYIGKHTFNEIANEYSENKAEFTLYVKAENETNNQEYKLVIYKQSKTARIKEITTTTMLADSTEKTFVAEQIGQTNAFITKLIKGVNGYELKIELDNAYAKISNVTVNPTEDDEENKVDLTSVLTLKNGENGVYIYNATEDIIGRTINITVEAEYKGIAPVEYTLTVESLSDDADFETIKLGENVLEFFKYEENNEEPIELDKIEAKIGAEESDSLDVIAKSETAKVEIYTIDEKGNIKILASGIGRATVNSLDLKVRDTATVYTKITSEDGQYEKVKELEVTRLSNNTNIVYVTFEVNGQTKTVEVLDVDDSNEKEVIIPETFMNSQNVKATVIPEDKNATVTYDEEEDTYKLIEDLSEEDSITVMVTAEDGTQEDYTINIRVISANTKITKQLVETSNEDEDSEIEVKSDDEFTDNGNDLYSVSIRGYETIDLLITPESDKATVELAIAKEADKVVENKKYINSNRITLNATIVTEVEVKITAEDGTEKIYTVQVSPEESIIKAVTVQPKGREQADEIINLTDDEIYEGVATIRVHPDNTSATIVLTATSKINTVNAIVNEGMTSNDGTLLEKTADTTINDSTVTIDVELLDRLLADATIVSIEVTTTTGNTEVITINLEKGSAEAILETATVTGVETGASKTTEPYNNTIEYSRDIIIDSEDTIYNITAKVRENGTYEIYKLPDNDISLSDIDVTDLEKIKTDTPIELSYNNQRFIIVVTSEFGQNTEKYDLYVKKLNHDVSIEDLTIIFDSEDGKVIHSVYDFGDFDANGNIDILVPAETSELVIRDLIISNKDAIAKWAKSDEIYEDYEIDAQIVYSAEELNGEKVYIKVITEDGTEKVYCLNINKVRELSPDTSILKVEADNDSVSETTVVGTTPDGETIEMYVLTIRDTVDPEVIVTLNNENASVTKVVPASSNVISTEPKDNKFTLSGIATDEHNVNEDTYIDTKTVDVTITVTAEDGSTTDYVIRLERKHTETGLVEIKYIGDNEEIVTIDSTDDLNIEIDSITEGITIVSAQPVCANANVYVVDDEGQRVEIGETGKYFSIEEETQREIKLVVVAEYGNEQEYILTVASNKKHIIITGKIITENYNNNYSGIEVNFIDKENEEIVYTAITEEDGTYSAEVATGTQYDMVVKKDGYLTYTITDIPAIDDVEICTGDSYLIAGEVAGDDDYIELRDLVKVNKKIALNSSASSDTDKACDFNEDGVIDDKDLEILVNNYDKVATSIPYEKIVEENPEEDITLQTIDNAYEMITNDMVELTAEEKAEDVIEETTKELILPISTEYRISSEYGTRIDPITKEETKFHHGIDIGANYQTPILAVADGTVVYAGENGGYGYCIEIKHEINGDIIYSFYAHLYKIDVKVGDTVVQGQTIGLEGGKPGDIGAGNSTGPHLHFEIRKQVGSYASAVDPRNYLEF